MERRAMAELIDATVPNLARATDYIDGGRDNFEGARLACLSPACGAVPSARGWRAPVPPHRHHPGSV
jgi:hypothetical protein